MQKYLISRDGTKKQLNIKEFAVVEWQPNQKDYTSLGADDFSFLHEESYSSASIQTAIADGRKTLVSELRTRNFYPIGVYLETIADSIIDLYASKKDRPVELLFNDIELLSITKDQ